MEMPNSAIVMKLYYIKVSRLFDPTKALLLKPLEKVQNLRFSLNMNGHTYRST